MPLTKEESAEVDALVAKALAEWEKWYVPRLTAAFVQANAAEDPMTDEEFERLISNSQHAAGRMRARPEEK